MYSLSIDIYGIPVRITTDSSFVLENLRKDFSLFITRETSSEEKNIVITARQQPAPYDLVPQVIASLHGPDLICYKDRNINYIVYANNSLLIYDFKDDTGELFSTDELFLYEKTKLTALSRIGERLDEQGLRRIHAFGVCLENKALLCMMPMQAGKTTTTINLLNADPGIKILADDVCLVNDAGHIHPFLLRIGTRDENLLRGVPPELVTTLNRPAYGVKHFIEPAAFNNRLGKTMPLTHILIGQRSFTTSTTIKPLSKIKSLMPLMESGVFGLGLPQLLEFFVRGDYKLFSARAWLILKRIVFCIALIFKTKTFQITIGRDKTLATAEILRFLKNRSL
jgi:hypothetical protein